MRSELCRLHYGMNAILAYNINTWLNLRRSALKVTK